MSYRTATLASIACALALIAAILSLSLAARSLAASEPLRTDARQASAAVTLASPCNEDEPCWNWARMGNGKRGVVTMWGTPKVVTCGQFRWLARHLDIDPRTPWMTGDYSCGRRHAQDSVLNY
jgi:hypothetical protein